jgi:hypothetical protein
VRVRTACLSLAFLLASVPAASAYTVTPKSAPAFRDSVGVVTHAVYYDTAYGDWPRAVAKLQELGVSHVRDGAYGNPAPQWRDWNERYYRAVGLAASRGVRFTFGMGRPGNRAGTLADLVRVVSGRLRYAAEALEAPNEFDKYVGGSRWPLRLAAYSRDLYRAVRANPALSGLPVVGPSLAAPDGPRRVGDLRSRLDVGNIHPYTGGLSPGPAHLRSELERASAISGRKPVWATEAGFHNALRSRAGQPPVSERAGAVYLLRTFLEHFRAGVERTFAYELVDEKPDPGLRDPEQHFGLLRSDWSPKPAFTALKNLLALTGPSGPRPALRPLRMDVSQPEGRVRRLVLQRADGTYLVALWRLDSVWDRNRRRPEDVPARSVSVTLPQGAGVAVADPAASAAARPLPARRGRVRVRLAERPLVLLVGTDRLPAARKR